MNFWLMIWVGKGTESRKPNTWKQLKINLPKKNKKRAQLDCVIYFQSLSNIGDKNGTFYTLTKSLSHQACWAEETLCSVLRIIFKVRKLKYSISNNVSINYIINGIKYFQSWKKEEKFCTTWQIKEIPFINARMKPQSSALSPYLFIQH